MNYFEFFELRPAYHIDLSALRRAYYSKSRLYHPDHSSSRSNEDQDFEFLSALNNQAYETLMDSTRRLHYILQTEFDPTREPDIKLPQQFLVEMMELHERLNESLSSNDKNTLEQCKKEIAEMQLEAEQRADHFIRSFDLGERSDELHQGLLDYYSKLKYFKRFKDQIEGTNTL